MASSCPPCPWQNVFSSSSVTTERGKVGPEAERASFLRRSREVLCPGPQLRSRLPLGIPVWASATHAARMSSMGKSLPGRVAIRRASATSCNRRMFAGVPRNQASRAMATGPDVDNDFVPLAATETCRSPPYRHRTRPCSACNPPRSPIPAGSRHLRNFLSSLRARALAARVVYRSTVAT